MRLRKKYLEDTPPPAKEVTVVRDDSRVVELMQENASLRAQLASATRPVLAAPVAQHDPVAYKFTFVRSPNNFIIEVIATPIGS